MSTAMRRDGDGRTGRTRPVTPVAAGGPAGPVTSRPPRPAPSVRSVGGTQRRRRRFRTATALATVDLTALLVAIAAAGELRPTTLLLGAVTVVLFATGGLYRHRLTLSALDDAPALAGRILAVIALGSTYRTLVGGDVMLAPRLRVVVVAIGLVLLGRTLAYAALRHLRRSRRIGYPTLIVGAGVIGQEVATILTRHAEYGLVPLGFYDPDPPAEPTRFLPLFDESDGLAETITELDTPVVIVAFSNASEPALVDSLRTCDRLDCEIFMVPRLFELHVGPGRHSDRIWSLNLVRLGRAAHRSPAWALKRLVDVVVAGAGLVLLSPLLGALALAVWLDGRDGVLFRQERVGVDQRRFTILKFRTMRPDSPQDSATTWNIRGDARVRPLGRFLRRTSLDELPQLWNVLRGDMSLVGPRPERPHFVGLFAEEYRGYTARHRVPCGLTGWAQVHGLRGDTSIEERARFDNDYIEHWSLWNDTKIILRTVTANLFRRGL